MLVGQADAQQPEAPKDKSKSRRSAWLHDVYVKEASAYKFFLDEKYQHKLELHCEPIMRWTSDADYNGEVFVWTHQGAAAVVGCIFSGPAGAGARQIVHEFHSLAPNSLYAQERGGSGWLPQESGAKFEPITDAPDPADTSARRLAQLRDLSRRFTSQVYRENSKWQMRLLTQPIYRYEISDANFPVVDGAVFAFVWTVGTDPEVLVVIEARRTNAGVRWYYAPARFTNCEAWLEYRGKQVWRADPSPTGIFDGVTTTRYGAFQVKTIPKQAGN
jgi:hypothetical protein